MRERGASSQEIDAITKRAREFYQSQQLTRAEERSAAKSNGLTQSANFQSTRSNCPGADSTLACSRQDPTEGVLSSSAGTAPPAHLSTSIAPALPEDDPPYPVTFDEIAEMIATGKPVPGIREIPTVINEAAPTEARVAKQQGAGLKPWERAT